MRGRRVALFTASLGAGGAERVLSHMARHWAAQGVDVAFVTLEGGYGDFFPLSPSVHRVALGLARPSRTLGERLFRNLARVRALRSEFLRLAPDVVISFIDQCNVLALAATLGLSVPVIVSERTDPRHHSLGLVWSGLRRALYRRAAAVVVQTDSVAGWARAFLPTEKVRVIPNPVLSADLRPRSPRGGARKALLAMGRLGPEKGFDLLLQAFADCAPVHPEWDLLLAGNGPERPSLEALARELGLQARVSFLGAVAAEGFFESGHLFVLPSRFEGFPNALLEAMAAGLPVIAFDCPSGPREILGGGEDGILVPPQDVRGLAAAMGRAMGSEALRTQLGARAVRVRARYGVEAVIRQWEELIDACLASRDRDVQ